MTRTKFDQKSTDAANKPDGSYVSRTDQSKVSRLIAQV